MSNETKLQLKFLLFVLIWSIVIVTIFSNFLFLSNFIFIVFNFLLLDTFQNNNFLLLFYFILFICECLNENKFCR